LWLSSTHARYADSRQLCPSTPLKRKEWERLMALMALSRLIFAKCSIFYCLVQNENHNS